MSLIERLLAGAPAIIEASAAPADYLLQVIDGGRTRIRCGASLTVCAGETAMLVADHRVVNQLAAGIHPLAGEQLADLAALYSWPDDYRGVIDAEVVFVSTAPRRHLWRADLDDGGTRVTGTIDLEVAEPQRFASYHLERGSRDDAAVLRLLDRLIERELGRLDDTLLADRKEAARLLRTRLHDELKARGLGEVTLRIHRLEAAGATTTPMPALAEVAEDTARAAANVHPLPLSTADPVGEDDDDQAELDPEAMQVIDELEREIQRLDAWSRIGESRPVDGGRREPSLSPDPHADRVPAPGSRREPVPTLPGAAERAAPVPPSQSDLLDLAAARGAGEDDAAQAPADADPATDEDWPSNLADEIDELLSDPGIGTDPGTFDRPRLPPELTASSFYIAVNMEQTGPFDADEFEQAVREGVVDAQTLVWYRGLDDWQPAGEVPALAALLRRD